MTGDNGHRSAPSEGRHWHFGWCEFFELSRQLLVHGQPVRIEAKPADVLVLLLERPGEVHTKDDLLGECWPDSRAGASDNSLTQAIRKLRVAFGGGRDELLLTVPNVGYRMAVPVTETVVVEPQVPVFHLESGDSIPKRPHWKAQRPLDAARTVWLAEHVKTHEVRVFKFAVDGVRLRALQREVTLSRLLEKSLIDARGFVRVMDWELEETPYFTESEYGGVNLLELSGTEQFKLLSLEERLALAADLAETVAAAHSLGILHNDLKPSNVLILENMDSLPGSLAGKIADFGVASLTQPERLRQMEITQHGFTEGEVASSPVGTGMYRAPEILAGGPASTLADVYALGVMLYQIACGDCVEPLSPGWESRIPDPLLREDIAAAANIDPAKRIPTAAELATRLRTVATRRAKRAEREAEQAGRDRDREELERARLRRPWIAVAVLALVVGLCASLWFARRAERARKEAEQGSRTLADMNRFLAEDLLAQSNPLTTKPGSTSQISLIDAIDKALPQIDRRFGKAPEVAARLHLVIGGALDARTDFTGAANQFAQAAERFREADGPLSQDAIVAELRRENSQMRTSLASFINMARGGFGVQQSLIAQLHGTRPDVEAWQALVESGIALFTSNTQQAVPRLKNAIQRAQATPEFSPSLLIALETRLLGIYLKLADGASAEQSARQVIATITGAEGPQSHALLQPLMFLQEALYIERKYKEALTQGDQNHALFSTILGPQNQLTMAALTARAETEEAMEDYTVAIRDELAINKAERSLPAGAYLAESTLSDVAAMECRLGRFGEGMAHAHQVILETGEGPAPQPVFKNAATLTLAECLIEQQETSGHSAGEAGAAEASRILSSVDVAHLAQSPGYANVEGVVDMARARLALLEGNHDLARRCAEKAAPYLAKPDADAYERKALVRVQAALAAH